MSKFVNPYVKCTCPDCGGRVEEETAQQCVQRIGGRLRYLWTRLFAANPLTQAVSQLGENMEIGISILFYTKRKFTFSLRRINVPGYAIEIWLGWLCITMGWLTKLAADG